MANTYINHLGSIMNSNDSHSSARRFLANRMTSLLAVALSCLCACSPSGDGAPLSTPTPGPGVNGGGSGTVATGSLGGPVILFTDAEAGPKQGGPNNHGVPIALFGTGFGAQRGTSTVTINGVEVASYLVWGEHNANNAALDMIVVQPGPAVTLGPVVVHVSGKDSNTDYTFAPTNGTVYYAAPTGSDTAACVESAPCATIQHVVTNRMQPGDAVLIRGGTLTESEIWIRDALGHSGQSGRPKLILNFPGEHPIFTNTARPFIVDANYITISGLHFQNGKSIGLGSETSHGNHVFNSTFRGLIDWDAIGTHGYDHVLAGNDCSVSGSTVGTQGHCYYISHGSNLKIRYNIGRGAPGYGLHIFDQRRATPDIQRIISNVLVEGNLFAGSTLRSGIIIAMNDEGNFGNYIDGITLRNNILTGNNHLGVTIGGIVRNVQIDHNTFYKNGRQGLYIDNATTVDGITIRNNLFDQTTNSNCTSNCSWYQEAHIQKGATARNVTVSTNYYAPAPMTLIGTTDTAGVAGLAGLVNGDGMDFHLQDTSSALGRGMMLPSVLRDFEGLLRPTTTTPDPGAFEHR